jgi:hypothetical protein
MVVIERLLLADAVHHLNDRKWAYSVEKLACSDDC